MNENILDEVFSILVAAPDEKPWITASGIATRLGNRVHKKQIEQLLLAHCQNCEDTQQKPKVRYSSLPSRKTLEVLCSAEAHDVLIKLFWLN